jgi:zinc transport system substrate-binding protein
MPFESVLLARISGGYPNLRMVDSTAGVRRLIFSEPHCHDHGDHEHDGACTDEEGADPHVWLDPARLGIIAGNMAQALSEAAPGDSAYFESNLEGLRKDLEAADTAIRTQLAPFAGRTFFVFHPAFGYFADTYGLIQKAVEIEGKSPTPRQLQALIAEAREHQVKTIFVQPQFDAKSAETIAKAIGGEVRPLDDLARNVLGNLHAMADAIADALSL